MEHGDLDNSSPPRVVLLLDCLLEGALPKKKRFQSSRAYVDSIPLNFEQGLARVHVYFLRNQVRIELALVGLDGSMAEAFEERLDREGMHPIAWCVAYPNREYLRNTLPYRPEILYVVDVDPRTATFWGRKGKAFNEL
jgi:hypothetical protein